MPGTIPIDDLNAENDEQQHLIIRLLRSIHSARSSCYVCATHNYRRAEHGTC